MGQTLDLTYECKGASVYNLREVNSSFAAGTMRVMYVGPNRKGTNISRAAVERSLHTLYNVPIVAHYDYDENVMGGHDMEPVVGKDGKLALRVLTEPCGVVPESATFSFEKGTDPDGNEHEYLVIEGLLLWKRQEVFSHIRDDLGGRADHSMEITILDGQQNESTGLYDVLQFEFTALCLLENNEPAFQGSELCLYAMDGFKQKLEQMMAELRQTMVASSNEDVDIHHSEEGGNNLTEQMNLIQQYGLDASALDFDYEKLTVEELKERLEALVKGKDEEAPADPEAQLDAEAEGEPDAKDEAGQEGAPEAVAAEQEAAEEQPDEGEAGAEPEAAQEQAEFALSAQIWEELTRALCAETVIAPWGEETCRYWPVDYDEEKMEVYATDCMDGLLYGFSYAMNGDAVQIDFASKKRMKWTVEPFEGEPQPQNAMYTKAVEQFTKKLDELNAFKASIEQEKLEASQEAVFTRFKELAGIEAYEKLRQAPGTMSAEELEEKCYSIKGRQMGTVKFSMDQKAPKILISQDADTPKKRAYGGLFEEFPPEG